jgi:hypothetical protein
MSTITTKPQQNEKAKQLFFILVFAGLLAAVFFFRDGDRRAQKATRDQALSNYGFHLDEVAKTCGIDFTHQAPTQLDPRLKHILPIIASMGASVAVVDFDRDGLQDLYVINSGEGSRNALYRNLGDGTFEDVAGKMGLADLNQPGSGACMGAIWGDFDNDGFEDLLVYRWGKPELFHNDQGKGFTRVTERTGLPAWVNANSAVWLDYDRDGYLDLFIAGYWRDDINLWKLDNTEIMPESFEYANNGGSKFLLRNKGLDANGKWLGFEDVTEAAGIKSKRWTLAVAAADLRGTGYPDLVLANDYGINEFYANQGGKKFVEIGARTGVGDRPKSGMSVCFGDVYNQGRFTIYTTNITEPGVLPQLNNLWVPEPGRARDDPHYVNLAGELGVAKGGWSWGAQFGDLNNDGLMDLFLTNGYISADRRSTYWYDYSKIAGAHKAIIFDAANWPDMRGRSLGGFQPKCVWLNRHGKFDDVCQAVGVTDTHDGRAVALADLWNRGVLDVICANQKGPALLYKNSVTKDNNWVQFELEGTRSNRSAIGAQVQLHWQDGRVQIQEVSGGNGYASQNQRRLHFGLGKDAGIKEVVINWPSGKTQTIASPQTGKRHSIKEPQ